MSDRGVIRNRQAASQIRDFRGMRWGSITPTDIDGFFEVGDKIYVFIESKHGDAPMPYGQELALQRLVDCVGQSKHALLVVCKHDTKIGEDILFDKCTVTKYRSNNHWHVPDSPICAKKLIDKFLKHVGHRGF